MKPEQLREDSFTRYPATGRNFAVASLELLRRLPIAVCPSVLEQILMLDTAFPAERASLRRQCTALASVPDDEFAELTAPLARISLPERLEKTDWVDAPVPFIATLTAHLWSSGQIDVFRAAAQKLFAAIPAQGHSPHRLTMVALGRDALIGAAPLLEKLRPWGVLLTALATEQMPKQIYEVFTQHAADTAEPYMNWYVDGGDPWAEGFDGLAGTLSISYPGFDGLRKMTLARMRQMTLVGGAGAEMMRAKLAATRAEDLDVAAVTQDPVLARFYTELFTLSSGPQIFSTSFVQWAGRELARRAQPRTLLLRYAPRQRYQPFDELLRTADPASTDPEGSLRDAEMGAYYTWIEMERITSPGNGTFIVWVEGTHQAMLIGKHSPRGTQSDMPLRLKEALELFG
jgi:hypothetical protein